MCIKEKIFKYGDQLIRRARKYSTELALFCYRVQRAVLTYILNSSVMLNAAIDLLILLSCSVNNRWNSSSGDKVNIDENRTRCVCINESLFKYGDQLIMRGN